MAEPSEQDETGFALINLLPNALTITAICAGMSAIRFGVQGNYVLAVQLIIAACVLDGLDGRIARLLSSDSKIGAELDSLADFLNFGVAPPLVLYFWALQDIRSAAWLAVLFYASCCVMRLARFNVGSKSEACDQNSAFFEGVPSPAGAVLVMLPMYLSFAFADAPLLPGLLICLYMVVIGLLLVSRIQTWSFKTTRISRENAKFFLIGVAVFSAAMLTFPWITLILLCFAYVGMVAWAWFDKEVHSNR